MAAEEKGPELPADSRGGLGIEKRERSEPGITSDGMASDEASAVVTDKGDPRQVEFIDDTADTSDVTVDREIGCGIESTGAGAGEIDQMTGHVIDEEGEEPSESCAVHRPAVHEQNIGALTDRSVGDFGPTDVDESMRRVAEKIGCGEVVEGHGSLQVVVVATKE